MLRIGIDLTAVPALKGGVGIYLGELISELQLIDEVNQYFLIVRADMLHALQAVSRNFTVVPVSLGSRPVRLVWEQLRLPRLARQLQLDVLHSPHYTRPLRSLPCASVVGIMDLTFFVLPDRHTFLKRVFFRTMIRASCRRADRLIAISESTKRDLVAHLNVKPSHVDVTPLAAASRYNTDISAASVAEVRGRYRLNEPYILFVGTLEPRKNLPRLLDAYERLRAGIPSAPRLVLAGSGGWHSGELEGRLKRLSAAVSVLGYVAEADLPPLYCGAVLFVYPSLYEGFGIPVLEAMACGVPTITSDGSSMSEIAGDSAELVNPLDSAEILSAMERLLTDGSRREELQKLGPKRAARFSWRRTAQLTRSCYLRAAGAANAS